MTKMIVGKRFVTSQVYVENNHIHFKGDSQDHKFLMDKFGVWCDFYATRSGIFAYDIIKFPIQNGDIVNTIELLRKEQATLQIEFFDIDHIKLKVGKLVLDKI